jgi:hypothetical protein
MAKLKSLKPKSKTLIFTSYGNDKEKNPAKIIFNRFPFGNETFANINKKEIFEGVDFEKLSEADTQKVVMDKIIDNYVNNIMTGNVDYKQFFEECVDSFQDFEYDESKIITVNDFWQILPDDAAQKIASEAYVYAMKKEEFTMGELSA